MSKKQVANNMPKANKPWSTNDEKKVLQDNKQHIPAKETARAVGRTTTAINDKVSQLKTNKSHA